ncbi:hypothetical protein K450DRAFT_169658 [Umbelopsis ramanniana AG]|uniref:PQ-loop-domain-containing protein n=1 Tax=Umbelopsis ramanniana AG TaxID=1314678 RepID=A0AAD5EGJ3_UMBRA|nr:uncharacterized protein K450DRAFT_169658 [Umbelopsis ramanniana AG]KAI8583431.1 hypothetical protein K450DRAFT_169658 [Umbelopsis ramanniana AG]
MTFDNAFWSSISGYLSIGCWLIVFTPQLWENYTRKSGDGLSMTFLVIWLLGDVFNLVGVVMQDLLFTMLLLAVWYTLADIGLIWQVLYYQNTRSERKRSEDSRETDPLLPRNILDEPTRRKRNQIIPIATLVISTIALIGSLVYYGFTHMDSDDSSHADKDKTQFQIIPQIMGWTSAALYIASRVPQIVKNYKDQSTEGLSLAMFFCAVMGNVFFTLSIFLRSVDPTYLLINLSWIIGSCGTLVFDFTVSLRIFN